MIPFIEGRLPRNPKIPAFFGTASYEDGGARMNIRIDCENNPEFWSFLQ